MKQGALKKLLCVLFICSFLLSFYACALPASENPAQSALQSEPVSSAAPTLAPTPTPTPSPTPTPTPTPTPILVSPETIEGDYEKQLPVDVIFQIPGLPTGCEITALTAALVFAGYSVDKMTMANTYLAISDNFYYANGRRIGPDLNEYFVGDPRYDDWGRVCFAPAIVNAANDYFADLGDEAKHTAVCITGVSAQTLYRLIASDIPVVTWCTISMAQRTPYEGWYLEDGSYQEYSLVDHCSVLTGIEKDYVTFADPLVGNVSYYKSAFEASFESRGRQAVVLIENDKLTQFLSEITPLLS